KKLVTAANGVDLESVGFGSKKLVNFFNGFQHIAYGNFHLKYFGKAFLHFFYSHGGLGAKNQRLNMRYQWIHVRCSLLVIRCSRSILKLSEFLTLKCYRFVP